jgi:hypothetical protein
MVMELDWIKNKGNNTLTEHYWLNILVKRGGKKVMSLKLTKYDFARP